MEKSKKSRGYFQNGEDENAQNYHAFKYYAYNFLLKVFKEGRGGKGEGGDGGEGKVRDGGEGEGEGEQSGRGRRGGGGREGEKDRASSLFPKPTLMAHSRIRALAIAKVFLKLFLNFIVFCSFISTSGSQKYCYLKKS